MSLPRREVLRFGALAAAATAVPLGTAGSAAAAGPAAGSPAAAPRATDTAAIVAAYRALQIGTGRASAARNAALASLDEIAVAYDAAMRTDQDQLWADLPVEPGSTYFPMMYYRLRTIAVDWATPGSALSTRADMPDRLRTALGTLYRTQYNEQTAELGNWYVYEIGVPYWLLQTVVALGDALPAADREQVLRPVLRFVADPNTRTVTPGLVETGANRADKSLITVVSGALGGDTARVAAGLAAVTDTAGGGAASLVARVTSSDGFHTDGSFIQHEVVPYSGHYGLVLLSAAAGLAAVTADSGTGLAPEVLAAFRDTVTDVYAPFLTSGAMLEPVRGRMLSRQGETGHDAGHQFVAAAVLLAASAPEPDRARLSGLAARWIGEDSWAPYLKVTGLDRFAGGLQPVGVPEVELAEELLAGRPRQPAVRPLHRTFPQMDRMVHSPGPWTASLGLSSTRICSYEAINGQNLHGWYVGDGVLYTFLPDRQGDYSDAYWPTVDPLLLPGTTETDTPPAAVADGTPTAVNPFTGGIRLSAELGAQGMDFTSADGTLAAKKAWFFTPDAVVCLGAGITSATARVRTTIENRNLGEGGDAALLIDGLPATAASRVLPRTHWLHLGDVGGYVLLDDSRNTPLALTRVDRTGAWLDIDTGANTHGTSTPYTRRYQQIVLDHGPAPQDARYAYAVLPGATAGATARAGDRWQVLANTADAQAVRLADGTVLAVHHAAARSGELTTDGQAAVGWGRDAAGWTLAVSDPTQLRDTVEVTIDRPVRRVLSADPTVTVLSYGPRLTVQVRTAGSLGATHTVTVR